MYLITLATPISIYAQTESTQKVETSVQVEKEMIEEAVEKVLDSREEKELTREEDELIMELVKDELNRRKEEDIRRKEKQEEYEKLDNIGTIILTIFTIIGIVGIGYNVLYIITH